MLRLRSISLVLAMVLCVPGAAFAAGTGARTSTVTVPAPAAAPSGVASPGVPAAATVPSALDIQLWPSESDGYNLVVSAQIADSVVLPATVRIPIPVGFSLGWVGEVFGGDPAQDIERPYVIEDGTGGKVLVVTATQSRVVQYEGLMPALVQDGSRYTAVLEWVQSAPSPSQGFAVKMVAATGDVKTEPAFTGAPQVSATGERLYTLPATQLSVGTSQKVTVSFARVAAGVTTAPPVSSGGGSIVLTVLFVLLGVAVVALVIVAARSTSRPPA